MLPSLIRRRSRKPMSEEAAFESTTFSLSTAVPRPAERRSDERVLSTLQVGKLASVGGEQLIRIRNLSAGGLMADCGVPPPVGDAVELEFSGQKIPSAIVWIREGAVGIKFDQNIDLGELLAGRKPRHGFRSRPPRLQVECRASVRVGRTFYTCNVHDISLGGMKVEPIGEYCLGKKVIVVIESLRPVKGEVRWYCDRRAGIVFDEELRFNELAEWVGKRLEVASLRAVHKSR